jgi:hypothetical protein
MAKVKSSSGKIILDENKVSCSCCCECSHETYFEQFSCQGNPIDYNCSGMGGCAGQTLNGNIYSPKFSNSCRKYQPVVILQGEGGFSVSLGRAFGSIGGKELRYCEQNDCVNGAQFSKGCEYPESIESNYTETTPDIEDYEDGFRMRISFQATATAAAGPFGPFGFFLWKFKDCGNINPPTSSGNGIGLLLL